MMALLRAIRGEFEIAVTVTPDMSGLLKFATARPKRKTSTVSATILRPAEEVQQSARNQDTAGD
jgi:hypothetical protein